MEIPDPDGLTAETDDRRFWRGEVVYDRKRTDILDDPLVIVDPDVVELGDLDNKTREQVKYNKTNKRMNGGRKLPEDTRCVRCSFLTERERRPTVESRVYTYPTFRLLRLTGNEKSSIPPFRPTMLAAAELIHHLEGSVAEGGIDSREELQVALMEAGLDGEVIAAAAELAREESKW